VLRDAKDTCREFMGNDLGGLESRSDSESESE
jgi:hypothetical protein